MNDKIIGLIIAAGLSSRMGDFKPLLDYRGKSFLENIVDKLNPICDEVVIITGHNANLIETEIKSFKNIEKIKTIFNENFKEGMFSSLKTGLRNSLNADWILYHFIDQPNLPISFYENLLCQTDNLFDWIQPEFEQKNGHPILLNKRLIKIITSSPVTCNLKEISSVNNIRKKHWNCEYPEILNDIDNIDSYKELIRY
ncbi:MAG: hypothetical protein COW71_00515 [Ignavibacteriales bacterium CG18_big_fil_WC_8_21_14_2_50_31_20]|nr:MAG: hypothetical protein COW71_00515 [Ignavibacteriales bacterium CG18_big_fil_WC_8_21_14_2_50_31_20]